MGQLHHGPGYRLPFRQGSASGPPRSGPLVTAGGVIFMGASSDRKFRVYDQATGKVLWQRDLRAATEGGPSTYEVNGKKYLVLCVGAGNGTFPPQVGKQTLPAAGQYLVFALSE